MPRWSTKQHLIDMAVALCRNFLCCFRSSPRLAVGCLLALVFLWRSRKGKRGSLIGSRSPGARVCMKQAQQSADREVTCEARCKAPLQHARVAHGAARWCTRCSVSDFFVLVSMQSTPLSSLCVFSTPTVAQCRLAREPRTHAKSGLGVVCVERISVS